jgi:sterol 3beta-glucosyltransferase
MNIGLQTWGTEGDVRPFIALAAGLTGRGHRVTLAASEITNQDFTEYGEKFNFEVHHAGRLELSPNEIKAVAAEIFNDRNPVRAGEKLMDNFFNPLAENMLSEAKNLCESCDLVIGHFFVYPLKIAAFKSKRPMAFMYTAPMLPSSQYPLPGLPNLGPLNILGWRLADFLVSRSWKPPMDKMFENEGVPKPRRIMAEMWHASALNIMAVSPTLFAKPIDWPDHYRVTGFLDIPDQDQTDDLPDHLARFLKKNPPPVYITLGSMLAAEPDPTEITRLLIESVIQAGCRAVIQSNWDDIPNLPEHPSICRVIRAPHQSVFPQCAAVVHHGGAGTTQSAVLAGKPSVVIEHTSDQPFWAEILYRNGVSPKWLHRKNLTPGKLARAIRQVLSSPQMTIKAESLSRQMKQENGLQTAIEIIEALGSRAPEQWQEPLIKVRPKEYNSI